MVDPSEDPASLPAQLLLIKKGVKGLCTQQTVELSITRFTLQSQETTSTKWWLAIN
jgi:hypothetical protein